MENHEHKNQVRIHIDQKPYESPNPTTGEALYKLGHVQPGLELFREVKGDKEDPKCRTARSPFAFGKTNIFIAARRSTRNSRSS
jgi:hypothetical protein